MGETLSSAAIDSKFGRVKVIRPHMAVGYQILSDVLSCQPIVLDIDDLICGVCRKQRLEPYVAESPNCHAAILRKMV
jgi:hypothetical protein